MKKLLIILSFAFFLFPIACKTKHLQLEKSQEHAKKQIQKLHESVTEFDKTQKTTSFEVKQNQSIELEIETTDSTNKKPLIIERSVTPTSEKIIVTGGKTRMKIVENTNQILTKTDNIFKEKEVITAKEQTKSQSDIVKIDKQKKVKTKGFSFGFYFWLLIAVILIIVGWRIKKFFE